VGTSLPQLLVLRMMYQHHLDMFLMMQVVVRGCTAAACKVQCSPVMYWALLLLRQLKHQ
jgi:hypothetical protein